MSEEADEKTLIIISQGFLANAGSDIVTFAVLAALPWFNHMFCGGSWAINGAIAFAWLVMISSRASGMRKKFTKTPAEARAFLDEHFPVKSHD